MRNAMITHIRLKFALILIAMFSLATTAHSQNDSTKLPPPAGAATRSACPPAKLVKAAQIHGQWRARFAPAPARLPANATLKIEQHAEFSESVAGFVIRKLGPSSGQPSQDGHAARAQLAGDLEDGFLTLDESSNGVSITGTWNGQMVEGSCGKKITGTWKDTSNSAPSDAPDVPFTLEKLSRR